MQYFLQLIQSSLLRWCKDNPFAIEFSNLCFHYTNNKYCDCDKTVTFVKSFHQVVLKSESQLVLTLEPRLSNRSICYLQLPSNSSGRWIIETFLWMILASAKIGRNAWRACQRPSYRSLEMLGSIGEGFPFIGQCLKKMKKYILSLSHS